MADCMNFPATVEEFMEQYKITDTEQVYTNGAELIPIFRMKQWFEHLTDTNVGNIEYISKRDAIDALQEKVFHNLTDEFYGAMQAIDELPSADVVQVVHGRWIKYTGMGKVQWMCSECSAEEKNPKVANYCYHCGAKMDREE